MSFIICGCNLQFKVVALAFAFFEGGELGIQRLDEGSVTELSLRAVTRAVSKISSCWVNTTSRRGIRQLVFSFGSIFFLFPMKVTGGYVLSSQGKFPTPAS